MESFLLYLIDIGPALFALAAFVGGILVLQRRAPGSRRETVQTVIGVTLVMIGLGIGACYGMMFLGSSL
jgi:hypothetical protein